MSFNGISDIEELEKSPAPCWLWDPLLNRISWANKTGLIFWGAENIFDILERRFDPQDQAIMFINGCYRELKTAAQKFSHDVSGYSCEEDLGFAAAEYHERYQYKLTLMRLADQRVGLLLQALTHPFQNQQAQDLHAFSVDALPMPAMMISPSGEIISRNAASDGFFENYTDFPELLKRCESAGMINDKIPLETEFGQRDIQYSLKRMRSDEDSSNFLMLFDDVTERKRTEKELLEKLAHRTRRTQNAVTEDTGRLKPEEADKFLALSKTLLDRSERNISPPVEPVEPIEPAPPIETGAQTNPTAQHDPSDPRTEELLAILNAAMDGIFTLDAEGHILSMNQGAEAIFGRASADVKDKSFSSLFDKSSVETVTEYLASLTQEGIASIFNDGREVLGIEKSGGQIPIFLTINPLHGRTDEHGGKKSPPAKYCALVRDITQWKETETELRRAKEEAEQASVDKSNFLNALSHEIRTPLNAILGFVDLMKTEKFGPLGDKRYKGYLTDIQTSGKHLMELTSGLLDLARMQAGKMEMDFTSVEPSEIVEQCVSILQEEAKRENILIRTDLHEDMPQIVADQGALRQIILNLLSNSIKFSKAGSQIIVSSQMLETGEAVINVSDTGIGMNSEELGLALEPFSQTARGKQTSKMSGTGLGLPLSKALAEANRARFEISSTPQKGTSVQIIFPNSRVLTE